MLNWIKWLVLGAIALVILALGGVYLTLYLSLPTLDGNEATSRIAAPVTLERDNMGQGVITAQDKFDAAYALGFAHGQDRFFQMDLQRRSASGRLSEWVGDVALEIDKGARFHQFSQRAVKVFDTLPLPQQQLLISYSHGVNAALDEYTVPPFEYVAAGLTLEPWQPTDSILVAYSMYLDLQGGQIEIDLARTALKETYGDDLYAFITQPSHHQAALDGSIIPYSSAEAPVYPASLGTPAMEPDDTLIKDNAPLNKSAPLEDSDITDANDEVKNDAASEDNDAPTGDLQSESASPETSASPEEKTINKNSTSHEKADLPNEDDLIEERNSTEERNSVEENNSIEEIKPTEENDPSKESMPIDAAETPSVDSANQESLPNDGSTSTDETGSSETKNSSKEAKTSVTGSTSEIESATDNADISEIENINTSDIPKATDNTNSADTEKTKDKSNNSDSDISSDSGSDGVSVNTTDNGGPRTENNTLSYYNAAELPDIGSNNWAVTGNLTATGSGLLANDMHLGLRVPIIWYRTQLNYFDTKKTDLKQTNLSQANSNPFSSNQAGTNQVNSNQAVSVTGVSLPGLPGVIVGTNNKVAWGFTNANLDNLDWILLSDDTPTKMVDEVIVSKEVSHTFQLEISQYGPVKHLDGKRYALNWVAHHPFAVNLSIVDLGTANTVHDAIAVGKDIAIPTQNMVIVDDTGSAAWLPGGAVMDRQQASFTAINANDITPASYTPARSTNLPVVINPSSDRIWTANARVIAADDIARLGDGGYALGARSQQIRDRLFEKDTFNENDFYAIQLDNHAQFLIPWQQLLSGLLLNDNIEFKADLAYLRTWGECACEDSVGYTLVKHFRKEVVSQLFGKILASIDKQGVESRSLLRGIEPAVWQLIHTQPDSWLPEGTGSFNDLLVDAYRRAKHALLDKYSPIEANMDDLRWGSVNALMVKHPFSAQIPFVGHKLNMDKVEGFGDTYMPAVQSPTFGASERFFVSPGHLDDAILTLPGAQSGHPLSPFFKAGFEDYATQAATPLLPGKLIHLRQWYPKDKE
ncbi:penicillin acylase family protein [Alteromonas sp. 1_MG-2023]|uniref:penicillin acylase family protein n=1 Tax=Alteromonas sp. 1_MG-2023 TaxID=3062669 RepID=UPI0026E2C0CF|nr:penicillin acylase family protein [Alteromonas sp. 1_MG-2023]MDO6567514.1 penicillin acylase family protein [Alteromonas sp. 1_MG-2023]